MSGLLTQLYTGYSGLVASQRGTQIAGQNIANANTPGYHRLSLQLEPAHGGDGYGTGVNVAGIQRVEDQLLATQLDASSANQAYADSRQTMLQQLEAATNGLGDNGVSNAIDGFFSSLSALAASPSNTTVRAQVLQAADTLAASFRNLDASISNAAKGASQEVLSAIPDVNTKLAQIAQLNRQIPTAEANGTTATDLRDQRQQLIDQLGSQIGTTSYEDSTGATNVLLGSVHLVQGAEVSQLAATATTDGQVTLTVAVGSGSVDLTGSLGGQMGGVVSVTNGTLPQLRSDLDSLAYDIANKVNIQHAAGVGLDNSTSLNLFLTSATSTGAAAAMQRNTAVGVKQLAASSTVAGLPGNGDNAQLLLALKDATLPTSGQTASDRIGQLQSDLGREIQSASGDASGFKAQASYLTSLREQTEGVSTDEEMVRLIQFQRSYQASAKVISTVNQMLNTLMEM